MSLHIFFSWAELCILLLSLLALLLIKIYQAKLFYTNHLFVRKFNMLDLQFPSSPVELSFYIKGLFCFPEPVSKKITGALKSYLLLNYLYYPIFCLFIFAFCMKASEKFGAWGKPFFIFLAWLQVITLICAFIANSSLKKKIKKNYQPGKPLKIYTVLLYLKYGISMFAIISAIAVFYYFWLSGGYQLNNVPYGGILIFIVILFLGIWFFLSKINRINLDLLKKIST